MPKNETITCPSGEPTQITDSAVAAARVSGTKDFYLCATSVGSAPSDIDGAIPMQGGTILAADLALGDLFPGIGASVYLWAWPTTGDVSVSVSHA